MAPKLFRRNRLRGITPLQFSLRVAALGVVAVVVPVLLMVAVAPLIWVLLPVAVLVLPFLIPAFSGEAGHGTSLGHAARAQPKSHS